MSGMGMAIDVLVALLLMLTIGYCMLLNRRLKVFKADEESLRATISELVTATEIAERAIAGLKLTVEECEEGLSARLASAEGLAAELGHRIAAGKELIDRLAQIVAVSGGQGEHPARTSERGTASSAIAVPVAATEGAAGSAAQWQKALTPPRSAQAVAAAAHAFAEKLRLKVNGRAA